MISSKEPMYIHIILYVIIAVLVFVLIKVAFIDPNKIVQEEKYFKQESRLRMSNLREAERLWQTEHKQFTDNMDSLITFLKTDPIVTKIMTGIDTITGKPTDPFKKLSEGELVWDSITHTPKSGQRYILQVDTNNVADTITNARGKIINIEKHITIGQRYYIDDPDGYGSIGDVNNDALKNTASWE